MASIHRDIIIEADPSDVWSALRDVHAVHERLVPGVLVDGYRDGDHRVVTFADGAVVRELIVDIDDDRRRVAYAVVESPMDAVHHHASMQVLAADESEDHGHTGSRLIWITDVVPDELAWPIADLMDQGAEAMQRTLGGRGREREDQPVGPNRSTRTRSTGTPASTTRWLAASANRAEPHT